MPAQAIRFGAIDARFLPIQHDATIGRWPIGRTDLWSALLLKGVEWHEFVIGL